MELTVGGKTLAEVKIQRGIFQGDALLLLLYVIAMMLFNYIIKKYVSDENLQNLLKISINLSLWMTSSCLKKRKKPQETKNKNKPPPQKFPKLQNLIQTIEIYSQDIRMDFDIEEMCYAYNEKWKKINNGRNRTAKSGKNQNSWKKTKI